MKKSNRFLSVTIKTEQGTILEFYAVTSLDRDDDGLIWIYWYDLDIGRCYGDITRVTPSELGFEYNSKTCLQELKGLYESTLQIEDLME